MEWTLLFALFFTHSATANKYAVVPSLAPPSLLPSELSSGVSIPQIPGVAGVDYPIFSQHLVSPSFTCTQTTPPGYYPHHPSRCQLFHVCEPEVGLSTFICPNGTIFNHKHSVCDWWFNAECVQPPEAASLHTSGYSVSDGSGRKLMRNLHRSNRFRSSSLRNEAIAQTYGGLVEPEIAPEIAEVVKEVAENHGYNGQPTSGDESGRRMRNGQRSNRFRTNSLRNEAIAQTYGGLVKPEVVPEVVEEVIESHGYNGQPTSGDGSGRRMRNGQRSNRIRSSSLGNEAIAQTYGSSVEPEVAPEVAEVVEEVVESHGYNGQPTSGDGSGRRMRNGQRSNRFRTNLLRNEETIVPLPVPTRDSYHQEIPEVVTEVAEVQDKVPSPIESHGYSGQSTSGGRGMRNQQRNNRFRSNFLRNEPTVESYGGPLVPPPAPIQSSYQQALPETTPLVVDAEEEVLSPIESHGYNGQSTSGGRRMRNQLRNNPFRSTFLRNEANGQNYGGSSVPPPPPAPAPILSSYHQALPETTPLVVDAEEEVAAPLETHGYNGQSTSGGRMLRNRVRNNRFRSNFLRNEPTVESYGGPLVPPPAPIQNSYPEVHPETIPVAIEEEAAPLEAQNYNGQSTSGADGGRRMRNQLRSNHFRSNILRNEANEQKYGGSSVPPPPAPAPILSSYHQTFPETTPSVVEPEEEVPAPLETHKYNGQAFSGSRKMRNQLRNSRFRSSGVRKNPTVQTYGGPLVPPPAPIQHSYNKEHPETTPTALPLEKEVLEAHSYNGQSSSSTGNGNRMRNQQRVNRLRSNGDATHTYGNPQPSPAIEEIVEEVVDEVAAHGYNVPSSARTGNGSNMRNQQRVNRLRSNGDATHTYGSPKPSPVVQEVVDEVDKEVVEEVTAHGYNGQLPSSTGNGKRMRNQERVNRLRSNGDVTQTYGSPKPSPVVQEVVEEVVEEVAAHGYNGQPSAGTGNGSKMVNRQRTSRLRSNGDATHTYGSPKPSPVVQEVVEEVTAQGYNGQLPSSTGNGNRMRNQQRVNRLRSNEDATHTYGSPKPSPVVQEVVEEVMEEVAAHGYNGQSSAGTGNGSKMNGPHRLRLNVMRNEGVVQSYGSSTTSGPAPIQHSYHQALPEVAEEVGEAEVEAEEVIVDGVGEGGPFIRNRLRSKGGKKTGSEEEAEVKPDYKVPVKNGAVEYGAGGELEPEVSVEGAKFGLRLTSGVSADLAGTRYDPSLGPETAAALPTNRKFALVNKH